LTRHPIEEGRAVTKSPHSKLAISFLCPSKQFIPNSAVGKFSPKTEGTKKKKQGY
jgi:hypothetical protein